MFIVETIKTLIIGWSDWTDQKIKNGMYSFADQSKRSVCKTYM